MRAHVDNQSFMQSFFRACLREDGVIVPGSERLGHNVLVNNGRDWLAELVSWAYIGDATIIPPDPPDSDIANTNRRIRWIGVGDSQHLETEAVVTLANAVTITTGPNVYLAVVDAPPTFLSPVWVKFARTLSTTEVSHSGPVIITEAGLYADQSISSVWSLDENSALNPVVAYKAFDGLVKSPGFTLDLEWSFRF